MKRKTRKPFLSKNRGNSLELTSLARVLAYSHSNCIVAEDCYTFRTTPPLQVHSVDCCSGRENRLLGGFFIFVYQHAFRPIAALAALAGHLYLNLPPLGTISYTVCNTTATLSACKGNAQPWRFFYACYLSSAGGHDA